MRVCSDRSVFAGEFVRRNLLLLEVHGKSLFTVANLFKFLQIVVPFFDIRARKNDKCYKTPVFLAK